MAKYSNYTLFGLIVDFNDDHANLRVPEASALSRTQA
jgi:hypothetical protein